VQEPTIKITEADLPLSCPQREVDVSSLHPKVYLAIDQQTPEVACPYCGLIYQLEPAD